MSFKKYLSATSAALVIAALTVSNVFADKNIIATGENTNATIVYSDKGEDLGTIQKGSWFNISEIKNGFGKISGIQYQGVFSSIKEGWVNLDNVKAIFLEAEEPIATGENNIELDIFDANGKKIGTIQQGSWFNIYEETTDKFRVRELQYKGVKSNIEEGWISKANITTIYLERETAISTGETLKDNIVYNEQGFEIGTIKAGTCFNIYEIKEGSPYDLYKIKQIQSSNIREGWVRSTNIKVTNLDGTIIMPDKDLIENKDIEKEGGNGLEDDPAIVKINTVDGLKCLGKNVVKIKPTKEIDNLFIYQLKITDGDFEFFINVKVEKTNIDVIEQLEKIADDFIATKPVVPNADIEKVSGTGSETDPVVFKVNTLKGVNTLINDKFDAIKTKVEEENNFFVYSIKLTNKENNTVLYTKVKVEKSNLQVIAELDKVENEGISSTPIIPNTDIEKISGTGLVSDPVVFLVNTEKGFNSIVNDNFEVVMTEERVEEGEFYVYTLRSTSTSTNGILCIKAKVKKDNVDVVKKFDTIEKDFVVPTPPEDDEEVPTPPAIEEEGEGTGVEENPYVYLVNTLEGLESIINDKVECYRIAPVVEDGDFYIYKLKIVNKVDKNTDDTTTYLNIKVRKDDTSIINRLASIQEEAPKEEEPEIPQEGDIVNEGGYGSKDDPFTLTVKSKAALTLVLDEISKISNSYSRIDEPEMIDENTIMYKLYYIEKSNLGVFVNIKVDKNNTSLITMLNSIHKMSFEDNTEVDLIEEGGTGTETDPYKVYALIHKGLDIVFQELKNQGYDYHRYGERVEFPDEYLDLTHYVYKLKLEKDGSTEYLELRIDNSDPTMEQRMEEIEHR